jgi:hypothetical protein
MKLHPFSNDCPKCGRIGAQKTGLGSAIVTYKPDNSTCDDDDECPDGEHLHLKCGCGYRYVTPTADASADASGDDDNEGFPDIMGPEETSSGSSSRLYR